MNWLNLGALPWLLLIPALITLYIFRPKPQRRVVPSLRLWEALPQVARSTAHIRRPPMSLLMLLQALLLAVGVAALLRPAFASPAPRHLLILLDASGSMQTINAGTTRFEQAKDQARQVASGMQAQDRATLLRIGAAVTTACSACTRSDLERALTAMQPGAGRAAISSALDIAAGLARRPEGYAGGIATVLISDGAFDPLATEGLPSSIRFIPVGSKRDNRAITVLNAQQPPDGSPGYVAYAHVENLSGSEAAVQVSAFADTVPLPQRNVTMPAGGHADFTWQLPAGTAGFSINLSPNDALAVDDSAAIFLPAAGQHKVLVKSTQPDLYSRVIAAIPGLEAVTEQKVTGDIAFTIVEGNVPDPLPAGSLLLVNPQGSFLPLRGSMMDAVPLGANSTHPFLAGLDLGALLVQRASVLDANSWLQPVVEAAQGPLLLAGERDGQRIVVLTFDPRNSNLPKLAAFPLLISNLADWLYPLAGTEALKPGQPIYLQPGASVKTPAGTVVQASGTGAYAETDQAGIYQVQEVGVPSSAPLSFAVNMADALESNLSPQPHPELERTTSTSPQSTTYQEYSLPLATFALLLLGAEWLFYCWKRGKM